MGQSAVYLKKTIDFNKGFRQLLSVLKNLAVAEYHMLERKLKYFEELQALAGEFFNAIDLSQVRHPFLVSNGKPIAVLAVTSDAGLLGGINMQVVSKALEVLRAEGGGHFLVMGERGQIYAQDGGVPFTAFSGVVDNARFQQASDMRDFLAKKVLNGTYGGVKVVYPRALSFVVHRVEVASLIPFARVESEASRAEAAAPEPSARRSIIFESDPDDVVEYLVYLVTGQKLFEIFGMSRVTEQAARFLHLEESCNKIQEMNHKLLLQYFRRRHEIIDANMRELFSARSLYAK